MPKERFHLLLADEALGILKASGAIHLNDERAKFACFLGSILPDVFFYDLPSFGLSALGSALHVFEGGAGLEFLRRRFEEEQGGLPPSLQALMLGVAGHFLADGFFHPVVSRLSNPPCPPCKHLELSAKSCHHWLESEQEAYWLGLLGPSDGYLHLLERFAAGGEETAPCVQYFRGLLVKAGLPGIPSEARIRRCLFWQAFWVRQFARSRWRKWRSRLLSMRSGKSLGALMVPVRPHPALLPSSQTAPTNQDRNIPGLLDPDLTARVVMSLATRLRELPARF